MLAWGCFFAYRKREENGFFRWDMLDDRNFYIGIILIPVGWVLLYSIFDEYKDLYRKSRIKTFARTFWLIFVGVLFLFFTLILDDTVVNYTGYIESFIVLFFLQSEAVLHAGATAIGHFYT